ncbi:type VI secretion system baseplate subunit TssG [Sansalvadorimonas sp. 2012CJ34-2]|uniref:Type VI secretion system baseplate subunit TssG n=1 Tax=Parendozoicomonas callyspongiae TaxID=2942213 RepID=A0ABT0PEY8_9GAMM|nr:type VI secretion system baseplate subunit TssG [Sansalvadorimonas sp. 2012CJ34-2]MCL6269332.1 type VI secretion system baseplate subunit TssG [Sansalvadorimonas sp. 2012CJ34-2]
MTAAEKPPGHKNKRPTVVDKLRSRPQEFDFFQAVRLLETIGQTEKAQAEKFASQPVAEQAPPHKELVRFLVSQNLSFSASDIARLKIREQEENDDPDNRHQWLMEVSFMGLTGSQGVMPQHFTETVLKELKAKNRSLRDFLDIFHHRTISLFYRAWRKYQLPAHVERHRIKHVGDFEPTKENDLYSHAVKSLVGLGTNAVQNRTALSDEIAAGMGGLLGRNIRSASALKSAILHHFGLKAEIEQFIGEWYHIPRDLQTQLPGVVNRNKGINNILGQNAVLGEQSWQIQSRFRVVLEPMSYKLYMSFLPGSHRLESLRSLVRLVAGTELDFDICIRVLEQELPALQLSQRADYYPMLGFNSRLESEVSNQMVVVAVPG